MAIGFFKKLKNGLVKAWNGVKKGAKWVNNKILKPVLKPIAKVAAPVIDTIVPGVGTAINAGLEIGSRIIDGDSGARNQAVDWAREKIRLRK